MYNNKPIIMYLLQLFSLVIYAGCVGVYEIKL